MPNLCQIAHERISAFLKPGDWAVDGTVGNGHDTCFLAERVGLQGRVLGFDVQEAALLSASKRLREAGVEDRVDLLLEGHEFMLEMAPHDAVGHVRVVMFNLGYLPGSDKSCVSRAETTVAALRQSLEIITKSACLSVLCYRGHPGGDEEYLRIMDWMDRLDPIQYDVQRFEAKPGDSTAPVLLLVSCSL